MDKITIEEGNRLIAEFMGGQIMADGLCAGYTKIKIPKWAFRLYDFDSMRIGGFEYHSSWDWLMPVVEKIEGLGYDSRINGNNSDGGYLCDFVDGSNNEISCATNYVYKINAAWQAVTSFINWYNNQKQ